MATCAAFRVAMVDSSGTAAKKALRFLAQRVLGLEREMAALLDDLNQLTQQACPGLRQTYGISTDGATTLLITVVNNPERLRSDAAFAALCGVSPLPASSEKTNRHRLNRGGNRQAHATLHRIVVVRLRWHKQTKAYASRRLQEGRSKLDHALSETLHCEGGIPHSSWPPTGEIRRRLSHQVPDCNSNQRPAAAPLRRNG